MSVHVGVASSHFTSAETACEDRLETAEFLGLTDPTSRTVHKLRVGSACWT